MNLLEIFFLLTYFIVPCMLSFYHGMMWHKFSKMSNSQTTTTVLFAVHYIIMIFVIRMPFFITILSNVLLLGFLFLGNKFQMIGLTGGIATGKSTVSSMLRDAGFEIIDADQISKQVSDDPSTLSAIKSKFGEEVFNDEGVLDRQKLGDIIFKSKQKRKTLNSIMQKKVFWKMFTEFLRLKFTEKKGWIILDVPLLYETKVLEWVCYPIIVVNVSDQDVVK